MITVCCGGSVSAIIDDIADGIWLCIRALVNWCRSQSSVACRLFYRTVVSVENYGLNKMEKRLKSLDPDRKETFFFFFSEML